MAEKIIEPRALEGFLLKLITLLNLAGEDKITETIIDKALGKLRDEKPSVHPDDVVNAVCDFYNIKSTQLKGVRRDAFLVKARQVCMYLLKTRLNITLVEIGNLLGGRDHTTIMHGIEKIEGLKNTPPIENDIKQIATFFEST